MLSPTQLDRYADILIWGLTVSRKKPFANADVVLVRFDLPALPLMEKVYARLLDLHLNPVVRMNPTCGMERDFYDKSAYKQLDFVAPGERELMGDLCGLISLLAPQSLTHLAHIDPEASLSAIQKLPFDHHAAAGMAGLVLAAEVTGPQQFKPVAYRTPRRLSLVISDAVPKESVKLELLDRNTRSTSTALMGPPIILRRGEPTEITFSPSAPDTVYAGGSDGTVFVSADAGRSWRKLQGREFLRHDREIEAIAVVR